jgi:hypothetical protein
MMDMNGAIARLQQDLKSGKIDPVDLTRMVEAMNFRPLQESAIVAQIPQIASTPTYEDPSIMELEDPSEKMPEVQIGSGPVFEGIDENQDIAQMPEVPVDTPAPADTPPVAETVSPSRSSGSGRVYIDDVPADRPRGAGVARLPEAMLDRLYFDQVQALVDDQRMRNESLARFAQAKSASIGDVWKAAFTTENTVGAWFAREPLPRFDSVPGYDPYEISPEDGSSDIDGYEQFAELFMYSRSPEQTAVIKQRIDRETQNRQILQEHGFQGFLATVAAGVTDPITLATMAIPIAQGAKIGTHMAFAAGSAGATEITLQAMQDTRTIEESITNTVGAALLTGVLGSAVTYLTKSQRDAIIKDMADIATDAPKSVGAAQFGAAGAKPIIEGPLAYMAGLMTKITPLGRTIQSEIGLVRATAQKLVDTKIRVEGDYTPTSAESLIKRDYSEVNAAIVQVRNIMNDSGLPPREFNRMLVESMRRGDKSTNPLIEKAAGILRKQIDDMWERAYQQNLPGTWRMVPDGEGGEIKEKVGATTAASYMTRRYDLNVIRNNPEGFKRAWAAAIADQRIRDGKSPLDPDDMYELTTDIYEKIINLRDGDVHWEVGPSGAAMLKERVDVRDEFLEEFLIQDWETLMNGYARSLAPRTRIAEMFGQNTGEFDMKTVLTQINNQYSVQINALDKRIDLATGKERNKLVKERNELASKMESEIRDIEVMRDRLLNVDQEASWMNPENRGVLSALRGMRSWNIISMLSNILISSIPDMARAITYNGGIKFAKAFAKSAFSRDLKRSNLPKDELAKLASAMERASAYRLGHLTEVEDGVVHTAFDKYMHKAADLVLTASGSKHWNSTMKTVIGYLASDKIGMALKSMKPADISFLKRMGLTDDMIKRAKVDFDKYATNDDGMWSLNIGRWNNRDLVENIEAGVIKEANGMVITPGAGDQPLLMTTEVGRTVFQFMSFAMAATNRMTLPLMQEGGMRPWLEISTQIALGAGVYALRQKMADKEISDRPEVILVEAIEKTGLPGYGAALFNAGAGLMGISPLSDEGHYYQHNGLSRVMGPSAGLVENLLRIPNAETSPEQRAKSIRKLMPMQNHFILRNLYDKLEEETADMFGAQTSPNF